jgi:flagellin
MSRINTNVPALLAARNLVNNQASLNTALQRLSTGLRINSGKDDPAGLIASEDLRSEKTAINAAIDNANRANNMIAVGEGALSEVNDLLVQLEDLVGRSSNTAAMGDEEVQANQLQIDSILDSINRIANTTTFQGKKLLNGNLDYTLSGVATSALAAVVVNGAKLPEGGSRNVTVQVTASAQFAQLKYGASTLSTAPVTLEVAGNYGTEQFSFAASTAVSAVAYAINQVKELTGVSATTSGGAALYFNSVGFGSNAYVSVAPINSTFVVTGGDSATTDHGVDAAVMINGTQAITDGLEASVRTSSLSVDVTLTADLGQTLATSTFAVVGGGANFSLAPEISLAGQESIGIASVTTGKLGDAIVGTLSSLGTGQTNELSARNFATGQRIIRAAIKQISTLRGRLGAFQKETLQSTINSLKVAYENTAAAESAIRDADFATETSNMTRAQILVQSSTAVLQMMNQAPQNVLTLLRG